MRMRIREGERERQRDRDRETERDREQKKTHPTLRMQQYLQMTPVVMPMTSAAQGAT
jgi:hypothetical protein